MKLLKPKKGFTLIELLVVIGILAVLAAIAIPSVAGLIDRANVSSDKTNANEMTNAIERFASEYELYCQDIASGAIPVDADGKPTGSLDSAQGRVYNVIQVATRDGIAGVEKAQGEPIDDKAIAIYRDTKYPANVKTVQAVVKNYTKTSSTTFTPKQSDKHYWYSPDCGIVVVANANITNVADLNKLVQSGVDAKGNELGESTKWLDITSEGAQTSDAVDEALNPDSGEGVYSGMTYREGSFEYIYGSAYCLSSDYWTGADGYCYYCDAYHTVRDTWTVHCVENVAEPSGKMLESINGVPVTIALACYKDCTNLVKAPEFSKNIEVVEYAFAGCSSLVSAPNFPSKAQDISFMFDGCTSLTYVPAIPSNVTYMEYTFNNCISLVSAPDMSNATNVVSMADTFTDCTSLKNVECLPPNVKYITDVFSGCSSLVVAPAIPSTVEEMYSAFIGCSSLVRSPVIPDGVDSLMMTFYGCESLVVAPVIPDTVMYLGEAFYGCTSLTTAPEIPDGAISMEYTFWNCSGLLGKIVVPNAVRDEDITNNSNVILEYK